MPTTAVQVNGYYWNYTLNGGAASIGTNVYNAFSSATTSGTNISGAIIIPSVLDGYPVTSIGQFAFSYGANLTSVTIPNSVTSIGDSAFYGFGGLTSVTILGNSLTTIGGQAFQSCSKLTNFTIPNLVTTIGNGAFSSCSGLTSVILPNFLTDLGDYAFGYCTGLTSINIPDSVTSIYASTFTTNNLNLIITISASKAIYFGKTSPSTNQSFFGGTSVDFVLPPTMTITTTTPGVTSGSTTNNATIALTFTSTESTTNFVVGDISLTNGTISSPLAGSGSVYTATFTPAGQGGCTIGVAANVFTNAAGYSNNASNIFNWTFDSVSPSMTITSTTVTSGSTTNNAKIALIFTASASTADFVVGDISVTNGALSNFAGSGTVYTATFTPANEGVCTIDVSSNKFTFAAGNSNNAATRFNWTFSTAWNSHTTANHIIKSYVKDFIDVSGSVVLRANSNLYISGNAETAGNVSLNRLFVTADASFNRRIFVGGDVSMNGNVAMIGDLSMNGTLTKCNFNNSSIPKSAFASTVPDGPNYNTPKIVYDQKFQANADVSMNGPTLAANNVKVSGNIVFNDGTVMNTYDNNILSTNPTVFNSSTFTALDICGNLVAGSYATSSDYRIKTNIVELDETYNVDKLRPVKYYQTQINREKYGLIAHELQEYYPDLVIGEKDGSELQRVNYMGLIAILINDIKRMKQNLAELESGI